MSTQDEYLEARALISEGLLKQKIGMSILRDIALTNAEWDARWAAQVELWDWENGVQR